MKKIVQAKNKLVAGLSLLTLCVGLMGDSKIAMGAISAKDGSSTSSEISADKTNDEINGFGKLKKSTMQPDYSCEGTTGYCLDWLHGRELSRL